MRLLGTSDVMATRPGYEDFADEGVEVVGGEDLDLDIDMVAVAFPVSDGLADSYTFHTNVTP